MSKIRRVGERVSYDVARQRVLCALGKSDTPRTASSLGEAIWTDVPGRISTQGLAFAAGRTIRKMRDEELIALTSLYSGSKAVAAAYRLTHKGRCAFAVLKAEMAIENTDEALASIAANTKLK